MSRITMRRTVVEPAGAQIGPEQSRVSALEIQFYGHDEPITIPLHAEPAAARARYLGVKADVIEAQRHNDRRVEIVRLLSCGLVRSMLRR